MELRRIILLSLVLVEGSAVCDGEQGLGEEDPHEPLPNKGGDGGSGDRAPATSSPANQLADMLVFFHSSDDCTPHLSCSDGLTCCPDSGYSCCPMESAPTGVGCCHLHNATCCENAEYCCPEDFICIGEGKCSYTKPANITGASPATLVTGATLSYTDPSQPSSPQP